MEQLIRIVDKSNIRLESIFQSGLVTSRSKTTFKGYQQTFPEFILALQAGSDGVSGGPVEIDLDEPAVDQLWEEVKGVIEVANSWMIPFLGMFGVVEGNGLSPFATSIDSPSDLRSMLNQFFRPPKRDTRGNTSMGLEAVTGDTLLNVDDSNDGDNELENEYSIGEEDFDVETPPVDVDIVRTHVTEIQAVGDDDTEDDLTLLDDSGAAPNDEADIEYFFDNGASEEAYISFKALVMCRDMSNVGKSAFKFIQLLQLGKCEKGALTSSSKYNSRNGRWFSQKASSGGCDADGVTGEGGADGELYIMRDSLIQLKCKRGKSESVESYRVLAFFSKYYNKWFVTPEKKFLWEANVSTTNNVRVLARLMKKSGSAYQEVELKAGGDWGPCQVYCIRHFSDILKVQNGLVDM
jgi:hypothetical protein